MLARDYVIVTSMKNPDEIEEKMYVMQMSNYRSRCSA